MNGWNPGDIAYKLTKNDDGLWSITLNPEQESKTIEYKFTRGDCV